MTTQRNSSEPRFTVYDRAERQASHLNRFSSFDCRYWIIDGETGEMVDEASTKATAKAIARDMNRES